MNSILNRIAEHKKQEVEFAKQKTPLNSLIDRESLPIRDFIGGLQRRIPAIIAEIKKASPSKGLIRADFDVASIAEIYEENGASCLSVLTDIHFFQGSPAYLAEAKTHSSLPILRKDFIIDPYQIYESRVLGADCILLIVAMLDDKQLHDYCQLAQELKMAVLVESHTLGEFERALKLPTPLMGVNNRSLHSFVTDIKTSIELVQYLPSDKILITESGINSRDDIKLMQEHGINAFLIGESLMREPDIGAKLTELMS
ncbi:indole-3-glycerol phosphate synthase TrpC [Legionella micdadei]|uniref:Indole-3-glycerol phosphate synthase n=1 Tax=Legionella micdadei TaxID=451 RepID=A0A098GDG4_LEGMI|nr:indole-3-glycerol phosphate synthase TrpC [Legionella micdadei]ARG97853.1 indole-3-glycerol phosphate synthase [Legionella micdadei]ARG99829.1 indole-3-glycerol phosphate synthase [Legionella micdadei]KTD28569.1 indole-3-glycerol phosphate synthase [Legionella micdadei]NSL19162.1 indole-3-glycerol phosphate synthase TrpC [Legionella micdadei]CEG60538.1 Indole-3-glycerol phosphate synthase [Legionella micdadei]